MIKKLILRLWNQEQHSYDKLIDTYVYFMTSTSIFVLHIEITSIHTPYSQPNKANHSKLLHVPILVFVIFTDYCPKL